MDEKTAQLKEACGKLEAKPEIVEFKTFGKGVGLNIHAHLVCEPVEEETHAKYDKEEKGFTCLICRKQNLIYEVGEINKHLEEKHDIDWDDQVIDGWTDKFTRQAEVYFSKKKSPR